jgi:hypothetical protein
MVVYTDRFKARMVRRLTGGAGSGKYPGASAVSLLGGARLTVAGDTSDTIAAGTKWGTYASSAIRIYKNSPLWIDSKIRLIPNRGAPSISGRLRSSPRPPPLPSQLEMF